MWTTRYTRISGAMMTSRLCYCFVLFLTCGCALVRGEDSNEGDGVTFIRASESVIYALITNNPLSQLEARRFCQTQYSGDLIVCSAETLSYVTGNLSNTLREHPGLLAATEAIWVKGKTDMADGQVLNISAHEIADTGDNCVVLSNASSAENTTLDGFFLFSKSDCSFGKRKFLCETTPQDMHRHTREQASFIFEGKLYKPVFDQATSFSAANSICREKYGGSLASIATQYQLDQLRDRLRNTVSGDAFREHNSFWVCGRVEAANGAVISLTTPPSFQTGSKCVVISSKTNGNDVTYELHAQECEGGSRDFFCVLNDTGSCPNGVTTQERDVWFDDDVTRYVAVLYVRADHNSGQALCQEQHGATLANVTTQSKLDMISNQLTNVLTNQHRDSVDEFWVAGMTSSPNHSVISLGTDSMSAGENCVVLSNLDHEGTFSLYSKPCNATERRVLCEVPVKNLLVHDFDDSSQYLFVMNHTLTYADAQEFCQVQYGGDLMERRDVTKLKSTVPELMRGQIGKEPSLFWVHQQNGCDRQFRGSCYISVSDRLDFQHASDRCKSFGGQLADISDGAENDVIHQLAAGIGRAVYIDGQDTQEEGVWRWVTSGELMTYTKWNRGEPNNLGTENCVFLYENRNGAWNDISCESTTSSVCEIKAGSCSGLRVTRAMIDSPSYLDIAAVPCSAHLPFTCAIKAVPPHKYYYVMDTCPGDKRVSNVRLAMTENDCTTVGGKWAERNCVLQLCGSNARAVRGWMFSSPGVCNGTSLPYTTTLARSECLRLNGKFDSYSLVGRCSLALCNSTKEPHLSYVISTRAACPVENVVSGISIGLHAKVCAALTTYDVIRDNMTAEVMLVGSSLQNAWHDCAMVLCQVKSDCKTTYLGEGYRGTLSQSINGHTCKRWDEVNVAVTAEDFPDDSVAEAANHCRNPTRWVEGPYCYTNQTHFEMCNLPFCEDTACQLSRPYIADLPDSALTASSSRSNAPTSQSKLNSVAKNNLIGAWSPWHYRMHYSYSGVRYWFRDHYIQADLGYIRRLDKIATQGCQDKNYWVNTYRVTYSMTLIGRFDDVLDNTSNPMIFNGNSDSNTIVYNTFTPPITTRYIRVYPKTWNGQMALRWDVFGCDKSNQGNTQTLQLGNKQFVLVLGRHDDPWQYCANAYDAHGAILDFMADFSVDSNQLHLTHNQQLWLWLARLSGSRDGISKVMLRARVPSWYPAGRIHPRDLHDGVLDWNVDEGLCVYLHISEKYNWTHSLYARDCGSHDVDHFLCERQQERYEDYEVEGGTEKPDIKDLEQCAMLCKGECRAACFYSAKGVCYHYSNPDDAKPGRYTPFFTYVQKAASECHRRTSSEQGITYVTSSIRALPRDVTDGDVPTVPSINAYTLEGVLHGAWLPNDTDPDPWIQVQLPVLYKIYGVVTKGSLRGNGLNDSWVETYTISYSRDCNAFTDLEQIFPGNDQPDKAVTNILPQAFYARCVRLRPKTHHNHIALRLELLACRDSSENIALGKRTTQGNALANNAAGRAVDGFLHADARWGSCSITAMQARPYFIVDLGSIYEVEKVTLQGRRHPNDFELGHEAIQRSHVDMATRAVFVDNRMFTQSGVVTSVSLFAKAAGSLRFGIYRPVGQTTCKYRLERESIVQVTEMGLNKIELEPGKRLDFSRGDHFGFAWSGRAVVAYDSSPNNASNYCHRQTVVRVRGTYTLSKEHTKRLYSIVAHASFTGKLSDFSVKVGQSFRPDASETKNPQFEQCAQVSGDLDPGQLLDVSCEPSRMGRFVMIQSDKTEAASLAICEIQVFSSKEPLRDVAKGKRSWQSSQFSPNDPSKWAPELAVDGVSDSPDRCARTAQERNPWWRVDLGEKYVIEAIAITPRGDCCGSDLRDLIIQVADDSDDESAHALCTYAAGNFRTGETKVLHCGAQTEGRVLKIEMRGQGYLALCEVEVYAKLADVFTYGGNGERRECVFPFVYNNVTYEKCTATDRDRLWCAVTDDYPRDGLWGYCMDVRLKDGRYAAEGRVEVLVNDKWESVCDDGWNDVAADVTCKQLGYTGGVAVYHPMFPQGRSKLLVNNVLCHGNETALTSCEHNLDTGHFCIATEAAGAICTAHEDIKFYGFPAHNRSLVDERANATIVLLDPIRVPGFIESWHLYARLHSDQVLLQLWRRVSDLQLNQYMLVGESEIHVGRPDYHKLVDPHHSMRVQPGDLIGFSFTNQNPIPYDVNPLPLCGGDNKVMYMPRLPGKVGDIHTFKVKDEHHLSCRLYSLFVKVKVEIVSHLHEFTDADLLFRVFLQQFKVTSADAVCKNSMGAEARHLNVTSSSLARIVKNELTSLGISGTFWMGDTLNMDGSVIDSLEWAPCQPEVSKRCLVLSNHNTREEFLWYSAACWEKHSIVCQIHVDTNQTRAVISTTTAMPKTETKNYTKHSSIVAPFVVPIVIIVLAALVITILLLLSKRHNQKPRSVLDYVIQSVRFHRNRASDVEILEVHTLPPAGHEDSGNPQPTEETRPSPKPAPPSQSFDNPLYSEYQLENGCHPHSDVIMD